MKQIVLLLPFLLLACGPKIQKPKDPRGYAGIDPVFQPYVDKYMAKKGSGLNYDIPIALVDLASRGTSAVGLCTRWSNDYRQIEVDIAYWNSSATGENEKIALIFHELGHCDLNRGHDSSLMANGWPTSLMYPYVVPYPNSYENYYLAEMFAPVNSSSFAMQSHAHNCVHDIEVESQPNEVINE